MRGMRLDIFSAFFAILVVSVCLAALQLIYFPSLHHTTVHREYEFIRRVKRCGSSKICSPWGYSDYALEENRRFGLIHNKSNSFVKNIYYIKVHKSGSTTVQNILQRFAISHNLKVAVYNRAWTMPFPDTADRRFLFEKILPGSNFEKYNIMCDHAVFNRSESEPYMVPNVTYIASLREPFSQLESSFEYFNLVRGFKLENYDDPIKYFLTQGPTRFQHRRSFRWVQNIQAFNMGYTNVTDNNLTSVFKYLSYLENTLDFVILLEQFDACLIYMKKMFSWDMKDILYLVQLPSARKYKVKRDPTLQKGLQELHQQLSTADYVIYDHFSRKTENLLQSQTKQFWQEVAFFQATLKKVQHFCNSICGQFSKVNFYKMTKQSQIKYVTTVMEKAVNIEDTAWNKGFNVTYGDCALMTFFTFDYNKALRVRQFEGACERNSKKHHSGATPQIQRAVWYRSRLKRSIWCDRKQRIVQTFPLKVFEDEILNKCPP